MGAEMNEREALKRALEALDCICSPLHVREITKVGNAIKAIKEALAQPDQEPVAWMREDEDCTDCIVWEQTEEHTIPLYTTPPKREWVGLTDAEIKSEAKYFCNGWYLENPERLVLLVKTIQAKLREKNSG
jgi:hypothetical protein